MEKVVLVGVFKKDRETSIDESSLEELRRLTATAGGTVSHVVTQRLARFHPRSLIGPGKVEEVAAAAREHRAKTVIFDEDLTPAQQLHLETAIGAKIVDRTRLILDIFSQRARTKEGELQIELAQLSYMLPRLTGSWRAFSQQVGGIGTRGPGERQLEYERRHIQYRIRYVKDAIRRMRKNREVQRRRRQSVPVPSVAVIGYTNAGKSSMLNRLTSFNAADGARSKVYADDKLFATLDPTTRRVCLPQGGWAVFTDTVGFISKLPTSLVAAFRSTLEEVSRADCLLHLEDGAAPNHNEHRRVVDGVLRELGARDIPQVLAMNKSDVLGEDRRTILGSRAPDRLLVSARTGEGIPEMLARIQAVLDHRWLLRELTLEHKHSHRLAEIYRCAQVIGRAYEGEKLRLRLRVTAENWKRLIQKVC